MVGCATNLFEGGAGGLPHAERGIMPNYPIVSYGVFHTLLFFGPAACDLFREKVSGTFPRPAAAEVIENAIGRMGGGHTKMLVHTPTGKRASPFEPRKDIWTHNGPTGGHTSGHTKNALVSILRPRMIAACVFYREGHIQELKHSPPAPAVLKGKAPRHCIPTRGFMRASCPTWDH